jgi:hypothetical protein
MPQHVSSHPQGPWRSLYASHLHEPATSFSTCHAGAVMQPCGRSRQRDGQHRVASRRVASRALAACALRPRIATHLHHSVYVYQCQSHDSTGGRRPLHGHATWQAAAPQLAPQRHTVATSHGAARPGDVHNQHMHIDASTAKQWSVVAAACVAVQDHKASACTVILRSAAPSPLPLALSQDF